MTWDREEVDRKNVRYRKRARNQEGGSKGKGSLQGVLQEMRFCREEELQAGRPNICLTKGHSEKGSWLTEGL